MKSIAAQALGVPDKQVVVVNAFEEELKRMGLPKEEIERLVNN